MLCQSSVNLLPTAFSPLPSTTNKPAEINWNDYNYQRTPLELGIVLARRGSISVAIRTARAKALKVASIM